MGFNSAFKGLNQLNFGKQLLLLLSSSSVGDCSGTVIKVLCYKSEGRWFDPS
jgi:hypothetical protein